MTDEHAESLSYYRANPPSCLDGLRCTAIETPGFRFDGHGSPINAIFEVVCPCGGTTFEAWGWMGEEDDDIHPPVTLHCDECEATYDIFDPAKHGWDGTQTKVFDNVDDDDDRAPVDFPESGLSEFVVRFEFGTDIDVRRRVSTTLIGDGDAELHGTPQDAFTWITILVRDGDELHVLFDWECA